MIWKWVGLSLGVLFANSCAFAQAGTTVDSLFSDYAYSTHTYNLKIPIGQTFINSSPTKGVSLVRAFRPDLHTRPYIKTDTNSRELTTLLTWNNSKSESFSSEVRQTSRGEVHSFQYRSTGTESETEAGNFLMELSADKHVPVALNLELGYGSAQLDLSDLSVENLNIVSGASDVIISYKKPNRSAMKTLIIKGGMSRIVLRNLELARAQTVKVENGMGNTKILLGNSCQHQSSIQLEVGAGSCILMMASEIPVKLEINGTFFSTIQLPPNFIKISETEYVNLAYKSNPDQAKSLYVDVGIGSFNLITFD